MSTTNSINQEQLDVAILKCANRLVKEKGNGDMNILFAGWYDYANGRVTLCFNDNKDGTITATYCADYMYFSKFKKEDILTPQPQSNEQP